MKTEKITCDQCGKDLTTTGNCVDKGAAEAFRVPPRGAFVDLSTYKIPVHFCGMKCICEWLEWE